MHAYFDVMSPHHGDDVILGKEEVLCKACTEDRKQEENHRRRDSFLRAMGWAQYNPEMTTESSPESSEEEEEDYPCQRAYWVTVYDHWDEFDEV